jgi:hypothetical protein
MALPDPYTPTERRPYECQRCGYRISAVRQSADYPQCGTQLADLGVPRE